MLVHFEPRFAIVLNRVMYLNRAHHNQLSGLQHARAGGSRGTPTQASSGRVPIATLGDKREEVVAVQQARQGPGKRDGTGRTFHPTEGH